MPMACVSGVTLAAGGASGPYSYTLYTAGKWLARSSPPAHESTLFALASRNTGATLSPPRPSDIVPGQKVLEEKKPTDLDRQAFSTPCQHFISGAPLDGRFNAVLSAARYVVPTCQHADDPRTLAYSLQSTVYVLHSTSTCE